MMDESEVSCLSGVAHVKNQKWRPVKIGLGALAPWRPGDGSTLGGQVMDESGDQSWEKSKVEASENRPWRLGPLAAR